MLERNSEIIFFKLDIITDGRAEARQMHLAKMPKKWPSYSTWIVQTGRLPQAEWVYISELEHLLSWFYISYFNNQA